MSQKSLFLFFIFFIIQNTFAQQKYKLSGVVVDDKTKTTMPFVNVFLEGTTIGTQTDADGQFSLSKIPYGKFKLVASMVGYLPYTQDFTDFSKDIKLDITLKEDVKYLSEVKVSTGRDKTWERQMRQFEREFLGSDFNRKLVKILNREIIEFTEENGSLVASAKQPLVIENKVLGYKYTYILQNFSKDKNRVAYKGLGRFELLDTTDHKMHLKYEKNRILAYEGSLKHFLKTFLNGNLEDEKYNAQYLNLDTQIEISGPPRQTIIPKNSVFATDMPNIYQIILDCPLLVTNSNSYPYQVSELKQLGNIYITADGDLYDPYTIQINGAMANKRIAKTLPFDYVLPNSKPSESNLQEITNLPEVLHNTLQYSREKVDIFGIEPFYLAGETLEFDAYLKDLTTQKPSEISNTLYIDIIDSDKGKLLIHKTLRIENGFINYQISTDNLLPTGNYQIRAYTNWMRNFSEKGFFKQNFTIFSQKYQKELTEISEKAVVDSVIIHVEGGKLVEGLRTKVLINSTDNFRKNIQTPFQLLSNKNETLIEGETDSLGRAIFELMPMESTSYLIIAANKKYFLPKTEKIGTTLTVDNISNAEKLKVFIQNKAIENQADTLTLAIIKEGKVLTYQSFLNNKPAILLNFPKDNLEGIHQLYLVDKLGQTIAERTIHIDQEIPLIERIKQDQELISEPPTGFLEVNKNLPFWDEKGITIKGKITRLNDKPNKKPIKLSMVLSSLPADSIQQARQNYTLETLEKFAFDDLIFYGKKQVTFIAPENRVIVDTSSSIPAIYAEKKPINWHLVKSTLGFADMELRKNELFEASLKANKTETSLNEVKVTAKKIDPLAVEGISPNYVLEEKQIVNMPFMNSIIEMLRNPRAYRFGKVPVFVDNLRLNEEDVANINELISPQSVESVVIFENIVPIAYSYGGNMCAIVINLRRGAMKSLNKTNETMIIKGYDN